MQADLATYIVIGMAVLVFAALTVAFFRIPVRAPEPTAEEVRARLLTVVSSLATLGGLDSFLDHVAATPGDLRSFGEELFGPWERAFLPASLYWHNTFSSEERLRLNQLNEVVQNARQAWDDCIAQEGSAFSDPRLTELVNTSTAVLATLRSKSTSAA